MKKRYIFSFIVAGATFMASCTKNFDEINTNPNKTTEEVIVPDYLLAQSQITFSQTGYDQLLFQAGWVQSLASTYSYYSNGDKYVFGGSGTGYFSYTWNRAYTAFAHIQEVKNLVKDKPEFANLDACATILRAMYIQRLTDLYGDVPFSEGGLAKSGIFTPKFDKQQDIYTSALTQLEAATKGIDVSKPGPKSDLFYNSDINKWKRLGYSLMLRFAMRLTKVDPATARKYAEMAYAGGTMESIADNAKVYADPNGNANSDTDVLLTPGDFSELRWGKTLIDLLKSNADPRVSAIAEIPAGNGLAANNNKAAGDNTASKQIGLPNGYTTSSIANAPGYPGATPADGATDSPAPLGKYSRPRYLVYSVDRSRANVIYTYGESELLLAEAASRGWNTGVAATHYANALAADMQSLAQLNMSSVAVVPSPDITAYVAAHPLVPATALSQINLEYYIVTSTLFNFNETYANWRRSGYPALTPVSFTGQYITGQVPRRMPYPVTLIQTNAAGVQGAISNQGADNFATRVWWDK